MKLSMGNLCSIAAGLFLLLISVSTFAQTPASGSAVPNLVVPNPVVPKLVNFSGTLTDLNRKPLNGVTGVTFLLYKDEQGGAPLWLETQNVQPGKTGHYTVMLGSTTNEGLPKMFSSTVKRAGSLCKSWDRKNSPAFC